MNITIPRDCQKLCQNKISCKSFLFHTNDQKCWLKSDDKYVQSDEITYVGPRQCPNGWYSIDYVILHKYE